VCSISHNKLTEPEEVVVSNSGCGLTVGVVMTCLAVECCYNVICNSVSICVEQAVGIVHHLATVMMDCKRRS